MKGIVFNLLEEIVVREYGEGIWDLLLEQTGLDGSYTSLGNYDDQELLALAGAASEAIGLPQGEVGRWYGRSAFPLLAGRFPQLLEPHQSVRSFVLTLNEIIHPEVRKLYPGATPPAFAFDASDEDRLIMDYDSERRLCAFAEGLLLGAGDYFQEPLTIDQLECMHRGDDRCRLEITTA